MAPDYETDHEHALDPEYLYPSDAEIFSIESHGDGLALVVVVPCPECHQEVKLTATVETAEETDLDLPLDDDLYD